MPKSITRDDILELPTEERLRLMEEIWDSLAAEPSSAPMPDWHRKELDHRLAARKERSDTTEPWDQVKARLMSPVDAPSKP